MPPESLEQSQTTIRTPNGFRLELKQSKEGVKIPGDVDGSQTGTGKRLFPRQNEIVAEENVRMVIIIRCRNQMLIECIFLIFNPNLGGFLPFSD